MADQLRYVMLQTTAAVDPDVLAMDRGDRWSWVGLMLYTRVHGNDGSLRLVDRGDGLKGVALYMGVEAAQVVDTIRRLPHVTLFRQGRRHNRDGEVVVVTWDNWRRYQAAAEDASGTLSPRFRRGSASLRRSKDNDENDLGQIEGGIRRGEESISEERKEDPALPGLDVPRGTVDRRQEVVDLLNALTGKNLRLTGQGAQFLGSRISEYGVEAVKRVVRVKVAKWRDDSKMRDYLTLDTLFRPGNFDKYLNEEGPLAMTPHEVEEDRRRLVWSDYRASVRAIESVNESRRQRGAELIEVPSPPSFPDPDAGGTS